MTSGGARPVSAWPKNGVIEKPSTKYEQKGSVNSEIALDVSNVGQFYCPIKDTAFFISLAVNLVSHEWIEWTARKICSLRQLKQ
jgi:hypothetical protein